MSIQFTAVEDFEWRVGENKKLMGQYVKGQVYTIRDTPQYDALREQAKEWLKEKKIVLGDFSAAAPNAASASKGKVVGSGTVSDTVPADPATGISDAIRARRKEARERGEDPNAEQ